MRNTMELTQFFAAMVAVLAVGFVSSFALAEEGGVRAAGNVSSYNLSYGLSFGAAYNYPINKNISVSADAKFQSYFIKYSTFSGDERILSTTV